MVDDKETGMQEDGSGDDTLGGWIYGAPNESSPLELKHS